MADTATGPGQGSAGRAQPVRLPLDRLVPVIDLATVPPEALLLRPDER